TYPTYMYPLAGLASSPKDRAWQRDVQYLGTCQGTGEELLYLSTVHGLLSACIGKAQTAARNPCCYLTSSAVQGAASQKKQHAEDHKHTLPITILGPMKKAGPGEDNSNIAVETSASS
ncbi:hypothetical protein CIB48_g12349, partial [Xylaria polymorpha]